MREGDIVGAQIGPDGKIDYSRAMRRLPDKKDREKSVEQGQPSGDKRTPEQKRIGEQSRVIDTLLEGINFGHNEAQLQEWRKVLVNALKDPRGSVANERDALFEPILDFAKRASFNFPFKREMQIKDADHLKKMLDNRQKSQKVLEILFDRYPDVLVNSENFSKELSSLKLDFDFGGWFKRILESDLSVEKVVAIDSLIKMFVEDISLTDEKGDLKNFDKVGKALPYLKAIFRLRRNWSRKLFNTDKDPEEVFDIKKRLDMIKEKAV